MKKYFLLIVTVLAFCSLICAQSDLLRAEIDKIIRYDTQIQYPDHEGFLIGIIDNDSTYVFHFGANPIDTLDLFEIGGLTKVFSSLYAVFLAESGKIDLASPINETLPSKYQNANLDQYTLEDLLMHQIPFPKRPADLSQKELEVGNPYAFYNKEDLLNYYATFRPRSRPRWSRKVLNYSHINHALIEVILEIMTQSSYRENFNQFLTSEIRMESSVIMCEENALTAGYDRSGQTPPPWTFQSFAASEGMCSNMKDLLTFLQLNLNTKEDDLGNTILESQELKKTSKISKKLSHSLAWYILESRKTGKIYTHSGTTARHKTYIHFKPETKTGVVILSKSSSGTGELGMLILRLINHNWKRK